MPRGLEEYAKALRKADRYRNGKRGDIYVERAYQELHMALSDYPHLRNQYRCPRGVEDYESLPRVGANRYQGSSYKEIREQVLADYATNPGRYDPHQVQERVEIGEDQRVKERVERLLAASRKHRFLS